jgi:hypothetical protein
VVSPVDHTETDDLDIVEGRTEAGVLRVFTRVAHGEHLHAAVQAQHPNRSTRRRPVAASGTSVRRTRGTTARKVIWS